MHPDPTQCPDNCYNLWRGFAAESMAPDVDLEALEPEVKAGLDQVLGHVMYYSRDTLGAYALR